MTAFLSDQPDYAVFLSLHHVRASSGSQGRTSSHVSSRGSAASGSVTVAGAEPITFSEFERVNGVSPCVVALVADVPTLGPLAMAALAVLLVLAALAVMKSQSSG